MALLLLLLLVENPPCFGLYKWSAPVATCSSSRRNCAFADRGSSRPTTCLARRRFASSMSHELLCFEARNGLPIMRANAGAKWAKSTDARFSILKSGNRLVPPYVRTALLLLHRAHTL